MQVRVGLPPTAGPKRHNLIITTPRHSPSPLHNLRRHPQATPHCSPDIEHFKLCLALLHHHSISDPTTTPPDMASKRAPKASADNEIDELFADIDTKKTAGSAATGKTPVSAKAKPGDDILAELEDQLGEKAPSRPHTPRIRDAPAAAKQRASLDLPQSGAAPRKSAETVRPLHSSLAPAATSGDLQESQGYVEQQAPQHVQQQQAVAAGGGWWGGLMSTATAAMKQAEAAVKEIQQNEEAKRWADQMRGNVGALRGLGKLLLFFLVSISRGNDDIPPEMEKSSMARPEMEWDGPKVACISAEPLGAQTREEGRWKVYVKICVFRLLQISVCRTAKTAMRRSALATIFQMVDGTRLIFSLRTPIS